MTPQPMDAVQACSIVPTMFEGEDNPNFYFVSAYDFDADVQ